MHFSSKNSATPLPPDDPKGCMQGQPPQMAINLGGPLHLLVDEFFSWAFNRSVTSELGEDMPSTFVSRLGP